METYRKSAIKFAKDYKGKLTGLNSEEFAKVLQDIEKRSKIASRLGGFAYLNMVTQMKNQEAVAFYQNIEEKLTDYVKPTIFFSLEFNKLPQQKINEWLKNDKVKAHK